MKFYRELQKHMIPEWKDAFIDYGHLKKIIKKIKLSRSHGNLKSAVTHPIRYISRKFSRRYSIHEGKQYELGPWHSTEDTDVKLFFERLDEELQKVNDFYAEKEEEFVERADVLAKQLQILLDFKRILREHHLLVNNSNSSHSNSDSVSISVSERTPLTPSRLRSPSPHHRSPTRISETIEEETEEGSLAGTSSAMGEMMEVLERNGVSFKEGSTATAERVVKSKMTPTVRIDVPHRTPTRMLVAATTVLWEDMLKNRGAYKKKIKSAEKMITEAYAELYRGLGLLKTFSSLNLTGFRKIVKKYDKVTGCRELQTYMQKVEGSRFVVSDKMIKLGDEVEFIFTEHLAKQDRKKAMELLRPRQSTESHTVIFLAGLLTGSFVTMFVVYVILAHIFGIFSSKGVDYAAYMETVYPIFSMFALLSLHLFLYGCNLYAWKRTRINHNFIFEFNPNTALMPRDAFIMSASIMTMAVGAMVLHLLLVSAGVVRHNEVDAIPGILLLLFLALLFCPLNIFYRSTRYLFLWILFKIVVSPLYRVHMVDFFLTDQLTSQIPLLRHLEFTSCFFAAGKFRKPMAGTCNTSLEYKIVFHMVSLLPYFWRAVQCVRRYVEEGRDLAHISNTVKYASTLVAAGARMKYEVSPTPAWLSVVILTSTIATIYQLYWDFVKDWGVFCKGSKNRWLRDELMLRNKRIYYISIVLNLVLRLAWVKSVIGISLGMGKNRILLFSLASLELVRRGQWNYYRVENEHLNNVGKFRAVKAVPLPFPDLHSI